MASTYSFGGQIYPYGQGPSPDFGAGSSYSSPGAAPAPQIVAPNPAAPPAPTYRPQPNIGTQPQYQAQPPYQPQSNPNAFNSPAGYGQGSGYGSNWNPYGSNFGISGPPVYGGPQAVGNNGSTNAPNGAWQMQVGGDQSIQDILRNLMNQTLQQGQYGQQAIQNALGPIAQFGSNLSNSFGNFQGQNQQVLSDLPSSVNWAGQAATGDLSTQNALVQQLLGQTTPTVQGIQGLQGQGLGQSATDMLNAIGGRITDPLQALMSGTAFQNQNPNAVAGTGLSTRAEDMLNAFGGLTQPTLQNLLGQNQTLQQGAGLFGQGLNPATQAALQTQAMDTSAQQYNNARQSVMTQLLNAGAMGGDVNNPGAGAAQIVNELGPLAAAQQQQQSQLQQQAILANQQALQQNYGTALGAAGTQLQSQLGALGQGLGAAQGFTGLEQGASDIANQLGLGAAQTMGSLGGQFTNTIQQALEANNQLALGGAGLTGNLASSLGSLYGQGAQGFGGLTNQLYNTSIGSLQPYLQGTQNSLQQLLGGSQALGAMGLQTTQGLNALTGPFAATATGNSGLLGSLLGGLSSMLGPLLPGIGTAIGNIGNNTQPIT